MRMDQLNPELDIFITKKKLSKLKIKELIFIKKFIDRLAVKPYINDETLVKIKHKFGVLPDITTWGDYFQTEIATEHWEKTDYEFYKIIQTVIYDIIISAMIFYKKDEQSIEQFTKFKWLALGGSLHETFESNEELDHFNILFSYYENMGLDLSLLQKEDFIFLSKFRLDAQAS